MVDRDRRTIEGARNKRDREASRKKEIQSEARDIGALPDVVDQARRDSCAKDFRRFCEIYLPETFPLAWSEDHLRAIAKVEQAVLHGGLCAYAMPRGSGKTSLAEAACMWSIIYGHRSFVVLIGSDQSAAVELLDSIKTEFESNELLAADFPEICFPIEKLEGIAHRANGQIYDGARTHIGWTAQEIIMPTIPGSLASGAIIRVAGITGRIRGMKHKRVDGKSLRPDLVIPDDPQTDESARSLTQSQARASVLSGAVLGLAGPRRKIAGIMPCTVIRPGDMADVILDPQKHPEWNGERTKMVYDWPKNAKLWEEYARIRADNLREDGTIKKATEYYRTNKDAMDEGAKIAWESRFNEDELSAIQNAMNLKLADEVTFFAEYQNEPLPETGFADEAWNADYICGRVGGYMRGAVPTWANRLTAFIDVQGKSLWWVVCAWSDSCDGAVIDYGTFPKEKRAYFTLRDQRHTLAHVIKGAGLEGQIRGGLERLTQALLTTRYEQPGGVELSIERCMIDANWGDSTTTVYEFCKASAFSAILIPSHGRGVGASGKPMSEWPKKPGEKMGNSWRISAKKRGIRNVLYDVNHWKSWLAARWLTAPGDPGALMLFGKDPARHRMFADHCCSEHRVRTTGRGRTIDEWKLRPGQDNHWWDGVVGCAVGASIQGMLPAPPSRDAARDPKEPRLPNKKAAKMSFAALQRAARDRKK